MSVSAPEFPAVDVLDEDQAAASVARLANRPPRIDQDSHDDIQLEKVQFEGRVSRALLTGAVKEATIEETMEGAHTLTFELHDPERELLNSNILRQATEVTLDGSHFRLAHVGKDGDAITATFEDRAINEMRKYKKAKKAYRDKVTRAEFIRALLLEMKRDRPKLYAPELHKKQRIAKLSADDRKNLSETKKIKFTKSGTQAGFSRGVIFNVKGVAAKHEQINNAEAILDTGVKMGVPRRLLVMAIQAAIGESTLYNLGHGDKAGPDSRGVFQQRSAGWGSLKTRTNPGKAAVKFYQRLLVQYRRHPHERNTILIHRVQINANPYHYAPFLEEAETIVALYFGGKRTYVGSETKHTYRKRRFPFQRKKGEDTWTCIQRLAEEVGWKAFMVRGTLFYVAEEDLYAQKPIVTLKEGEDGVDSIDFDYDTGHKLTEAKVTCRAERWTVPVGKTVELAGPLGVAEGRWLVASKSRSLFSSQMELNLKKPTHSLPEPAPEVESVPHLGALTGSDPSGKFPESGGGKGGVWGRGGVMRRLWNACVKMNRAHHPYVYGGGHGGRYAPTGGGYDCSSSVSTVLHMAGLHHGGPQTTVGLQSWGRAGRGRYFTIWVKPYGSQAHVFLEFHLKGRTVHFGTGRWGKSWSGPGFNPSIHPKSGFHPRHWPGL